MSACVSSERNESAKVCSPWRFAFVVAVAAAPLVVGCSSDPFCGDGNLDLGEECDDGNGDDTDFCLSSCEARELSSLTLKWEFNAGAADGFTGDGCFDLGATDVSVRLSNGIEEWTEVDSCSFRQVVFFDIAAGQYTAELTITDRDGIELTQGRPVEEIDFDGGNTTVLVGVSPNSWTRSYRGTFFFRTTWEGESCVDASSPVASQRLTLSAGGQVVAATTEGGAALDGSEASPCVGLDEEFPQAVLDLPFGPAELIVEGIDDEENVIYRGEHDTFIGAGLNNPELVFDAVLLPSESM